MELTSWSTCMPVDSKYSWLFDYKSHHFTVPSFKKILKYVPDQYATAQMFKMNEPNPSSRSETIIYTNNAVYIMKQLYAMRIMSYISATNHGRCVIRIKDIDITSLMLIDATNVDLCVSFPYLGHMYSVCNMANCEYCAYDICAKYATWSQWELSINEKLTNYAAQLDQMYAERDIKIMPYLIATFIAFMQMTNMNIIYKEFYKDGEASSLNKILITTDFEFTYKPACSYLHVSCN